VPGGGEDLVGDRDDRLLVAAAPREAAVALAEVGALGAAGGPGGLRSGWRAATGSPCVFWRTCACRRTRCSAAPDMSGQGCRGGVMEIRLGSAVLSIDAPRRRAAVTVDFVGTLGASRMASRKAHCPAGRRGLHGPALCTNRRGLHLPVANQPRWDLPGSGRPATATVDDAMGSPAVPTIRADERLLGGTRAVAGR
jgi:hypothetical protein